MIYGRYPASYWYGACFLFGASVAQWDQGFQAPQKIMQEAFFPNYMARKIPHHKEKNVQPGALWEQYEFSPLVGYQSGYGDALGGGVASPEEHNRVKRRAKKRRSKGKRSRHYRSTAPPSVGPRTEAAALSNATTEVPIGRAGMETYQTLDDDLGFAEVPKDLYQTHLRPGVIFRIHLSEAIIKMQSRHYGDHKDESVIEADVEYLRLTRKLISDEISKFEEFRRLMGWFINRTELVQEHACNTHYLTKGVPSTAWTDVEENMKRTCLFDNVYVDQVPYVVGEDRSLMAAVAPPVLHCDAATCTSVPYVDNLMFEEKLPMSNVRTVTRCQASCRARCKNDPDCLKRCAERCLPKD